MKDQHNCTCTCEVHEHGKATKRKRLAEDQHVEEALEIIRRSDPDNYLIRQVYVTRKHRDLELLDLNPECLTVFNPESVLQPNSHAEARILLVITEELHFVILYHDRLTGLWF